jgi:hypothetical protein
MAKPYSDDLRARVVGAGQGRIDLPACTGVAREDLQPKRAGRCFRFSQRGGGAGRIGRIDKEPNTDRLGNQLVQKAKPFGFHFYGSSVRLTNLPLEFNRARLLRMVGLYGSSS